MQEAVVREIYGKGCAIRHLHKVQKSGQIKKVDTKEQASETGVSDASVWNRHWPERGGRRPCTIKRHGNEGTQVQIARQDKIV